MKPETALFLDKAQQQLERSQIALGVGLDDDAGRMAYLAAFHAAQAFIFEGRNKAVKTHRGVRTEFLRLAKEARIDAELRAFLGKSYDFKTIADYAIDPDLRVSAESARDAIATARRFVACIAALLPP